MIFSINTGLLEACVLALLKDSDSYLLPISESTLYPVLKRLQTSGYLETYDQPIDGRNRKYYKITPAGLRQHELYIGEWKSYKELIDKIFKGTAL